MPQAPFTPWMPQPPHLQSPAVPQYAQTQAPYPQTAYIVCDECKKPITKGQRCIEFFEGKADSDPQSGEPTIVDAEDSSGLTHAHWACFLKHAVENIAEEDDVAMEGFYETLNEMAWEIYEQEMTAQEEHAALKRRIEDPES